MQFIDPKIEEYAISKSNVPSSLLDELEKFTSENVELPQMLIGKMEASFLGFLIRSIEAKTIVEFGTFTGYSALAMAENLSQGGKVYTLDISTETTKIAKSFWNRSSHKDKIISLIGPALDTIHQIDEQIDLAFIDADKENYLNYLKICLDRLSSNGIIVIDNVLWSGKVLEAAQDSSTQSIQQLNDFIASRDNLYGTLLPVRDGIFLVKKL